MKIIQIDASKWSKWQDFYEAVLPAIGAPEWHGKNANALMESMVWGGINDVEPPYTVVIHSTTELPLDIKSNLYSIRGNLEEARADYRVVQGRDIDVSIDVED